MTPRADPPRPAWPGWARSSPTGAPRPGIRLCCHHCCHNRALADGTEDVVLYTDLANPTSNAIYHDDAEERVFVEHRAGADRLPGADDRRSVADTAGSSHPRGPG